MFTKEDYMKLPKERLAELLVEKDNMSTPYITYTPFSQIIPCYAPDGICTNPLGDCINCPKRGRTDNIITTTNTTASTLNAKIDNPIDFIERCVGKENKDNQQTP